MQARDTYIGHLIIKIGELIKLALPIVGGLALLFFLWGVFQFIIKADSENDRAEGKQRMIWGIVALFVIVATWGLVTFLGTVFSVDTHTSGAAAPYDPLTDCGGFDQPLCES